MIEHNDKDNNNSAYWVLNPIFIMKSSMSFEAVANDFMNMFLFGAIEKW